MFVLDAAASSRAVLTGGDRDRTGRVAPVRPLAAISARPHSPAARRGVAQRTALLARLLTADAIPVIVLRAPAGYGKTTVLTQWATADTRPFTWLTLEDSHNDPARLLRDLAAATASVRSPQMPGLRLLRRIEPAPPETRARGVEAVLGVITTPFVLVLDDAHLVTQDAARRVIDQLMVSMPVGSQIVVATRGAVARVAGSVRTTMHRILEITAQDLAFDADEARTVLGPDFSPDAARAAFERCEGWPAGISLAAVSAPVRTNEPWSAARADRDHAVPEYLHSEVLSGLDEPTMTFLTRTAILDKLSGGVCDAVCGRTGSGVLLERLRGSNLLIVPLDEQGQRYRYHQQLRRALLAELQRREPDLTRVLHQRAGRWFAAHDDVDSAVRHSKLAGDMLGTGDLVWANLNPGIGPGRLRHWLADLSDEQLGRSPELVVASAWLSLMTGDLDVTVRWQALAEAREGRNWHADIEGSERRGALAVLRGWRAPAGLADMYRASTAAFDALPADSGWRPFAGALSGIALALSGRHKAAEDRLRVSEELARGLGQHAARADCLAALGCLAFDRGEWQESQQLILAAGRVLVDHALMDLPTSAYAVSVVGVGVARAGRSAEATRLVELGIRLTAVLAGFAPWLQIHGRILQANTCLLVGEVATARRLTLRARELLRRCDAAETASGTQRAALDRAETLLTQTSPDSPFGALPFTVAELRVLQLLPTYMTFPEMATVLFVSRHTVKTQALCVYRKLGATSRHEAVQRACALGYLPPVVIPGKLE